MTEQGASERTAGRENESLWALAASGADDGGACVGESGIARGPDDELIDHVVDLDNLHVDNNNDVVVDHHLNVNNINVHNDDHRSNNDVVLNNIVDHLVDDDIEHHDVVNIDLDHIVDTR